MQIDTDKMLELESKFAPEVVEYVRANYRIVERSGDEWEVQRFTETFGGFVRIRDTHDPHDAWRDELRARRKAVKPDVIAWPPSP